MVATDVGRAPSRGPVDSRLGHAIEKLAEFCRWHRPGSGRAWDAVVLCQVSRRHVGRRPREDHPGPH